MARNKEEESSLKSKYNMLVFIAILIGLLGLYLIAQINKENDKDEPSPEKVNDVITTEEDFVIIEDKKEIKEIIEEDKMSEEMLEILSIADKKVQSLSYKYKGPQTQNNLYEFFVKGNKVKYILYPTYKSIDLNDDAYDTIYLNKETREAQAYCDDRKCRVKGKKADLNFDEAYIWTALDWLESIEYAEKVGEEIIDRRNTYKLEARKLGVIWVETFFGVPLQAELNDNKYQFAQMKFNGVSDEEVTPY